MKNTKACPLEHVEQANLFAWAKLHGEQCPVLGKMFAVPNGGHRHKAVAKKLKAEGVKAGVPDIFFPCPSGGYHGLFIEMKRQKGSKTSQEQKAWIEYLTAAGYRAVVCRGWIMAANLIVDYLGLPESVRPQ